MTDRMTDEQAWLEQRQREEREYENARYEQEIESQYIEQMEERIRELERKYDLLKRENEELWEIINQIRALLEDE